ncbi:MAG TPA: polyamine aminopropyltransferase [Arenibaculum sp.]|nr:polyamine aminopropyltransferase [Arenibaculum sp.]
MGGNANEAASGRSPAKPPEWFEETLHPDLGQRFRMERILFRERTALQDLVIFENPVLGRMLALDGVVQTAEGDEFIYHEMLTHVPILAHGAARRILVIGGGDGGMLRRCLEHPGVERVTMVEIDRGVVDLCREYLPSIGGAAFDDPRTDLVIADGCRYVAETADRFDVVIVDSTDPHGPGEALFTSAFYAGCKRCLTPGGVLVTQNGVPFFQPDELVDTWRMRKALFADSWFYAAPVPSYYGGFMAFGWATDDEGLRGLAAADIAPRMAAAGLRPRYYTPEIHAGSFALPQYVLSLMA